MHSRRLSPGRCSGAPTAPTPGLAELAAAYGHGLATGHPFHDGNKRIAFVTMAVFLELNGAPLEADEAEVVTVMLSLAAGETTEEQLASWVSTRTATAGQASG